MYIFGTDIPITAIFLILFILQIIIITELYILWRKHGHRRN
jgi:hypothetical protein